MTLPTCPREDCTFAGPHHDHCRTTGEARDRSEESDCMHCATPKYSRCYALRTPQPQPAAVVLPTVDEVASVVARSDPRAATVHGRHIRAAQAALDLIAARLPVWQPVEPQPIDPADVRVGDRVRVEWKTGDATVTDVEADGDIGLLTDDGGILWASLAGDRHDRADLYLLHRPEPEDPRVAVVAKAMSDALDDNGVTTCDWTAEARDILAKLDGLDR